MGRNNRGGISGVGGVGGGGGGDVDGAMTEEGMRWQMQIQEDKINEEIMQEREEEIKNIHKGMHQVNEIYKVGRALVYCLSSYLFLKPLYLTR